MTAYTNWSETDRQPAKAFGGCLAARDGKSVDTVLALQLRSAQSEWLEREIPGFAAALSWPY